MAQLLSLDDSIPGVKGLPPLAAGNFDITKWFTSAGAIVTNGPYVPSGAGVITEFPENSPTSTPSQTSTWGDIISGAIFGPWAGTFAGTNQQSTIQQNAQKTADTLNAINVERFVTVFVGLLFIFGGLYVLGTSQVSDAIANAVKKAAA